MQIAVVATARKLAVLCWHLIISGEDYAYAQPSLVAHKRRKLELRAGLPWPAGRRASRRATRCRLSVLPNVPSPPRPRWPTGSRSQPGNPPVPRQNRGGHARYARPLPQDRCRQVGVDVAATTGARLSRPSRGNAARQG